MRKFFRSVHWSDKLVDILVVVLGITIAFWLNNWQQERQNARSEQQYLRNLQEDLVKDSINLTEGYTYMDQISANTSKILRLVNEKSDLDSIPLYFSVFGDDFLIFKPEDYTYEALGQTGSITIIQSDSIREVLSQLYDTYELYQLQVDIAWRYQFDLMIPYYYNYDYYNAEVTDESAYLSPNFRTTLVFYRSNLLNRRQLMQEALNKIGILRNLIRQELQE